MVAIFTLGLLACQDFPWFGKKPGDSDPGSGDDSGGTGGDNGDDSGGNTSGFCSKKLDSTTPGGPDCVTDTISCGQTIQGTTKGGLSVLNEDLYDSWFCGYPAPSSFEGAERVYILDLDGAYDIHVSLSSPCKEVDLLAIHFESERCPYENVPISECEAAWKDGDDQQTLYTDRAYRFFLVVESRSGDPTNFELSVDCTAL
jgi:hypothetical protein